MLCLSIAQTTTVDVVTTIAKYRKHADLFEVRVDRVSDLDLAAVLAAGKRTLLLTALGPTPDGQEARPILEAAIRAGVGYVCAPPELIELLAEQKTRKTRLIAAIHEDSVTPPDLSALADRAFASGADIAKVVTRALKVSDNFSVLDYLRSETRPVIAFCSGDLGTPSRIVAVPSGSLLTFCCADDGPKTADGQVPITQMRTVYDTHRLKEPFRIFGVMGDPVGQSWSPALFNSVFAEQEKNAIYLPFLTRDVDDMLEIIRRVPIRGMSVTIPHKETVFEKLDGVDTNTTASGSVNTIVNEDGNLVGYNTDTDAAMDLVPADLRDVRATLLGSGGTARAIAATLVARGARLTICGRTPQRAQGLARQVGADWRPWEERETIETDFWINATPIGMVPEVDASPISAGVLRGVETVFDVVYNPPETKLVQMAWKTGCKVIRGLDMFLGQAARQYELWFGTQAPRETLQKALEDMQ